MAAAFRTGLHRAKPGSVNLKCAPELAHVLVAKEGGMAGRRRVACVVRGVWVRVDMVVVLLGTGAF